MTLTTYTGVSDIQSAIWAKGEHNFQTMSKEINGITYTGSVDIRRAEGRNNDLANLIKSNTVYTVKPNGSENEMYKSTTGCGGTVRSKTTTGMTYCLDCKGKHSNSNWKLECELATSVWGTCMICDRKGVTATRIMLDAFVFGAKTSCRKSRKYNGKHRGCGQHGEWKEVKRPSNNHESA